MSSRTVKSLTVLLIFAGMAGNSPAPAKEKPRINKGGASYFRDMSKMRLESPQTRRAGDFKVNGSNSLNRVNAMRNCVRDTLLSQYSLFSTGNIIEGVCPEG
ncbi:MAG: hypothetical protein IT342_20785 [Candidatus Melainabacteria bacterium]|nr:hypothetical protein [Candidatus Melainabacteria bacterium]